MARRGVEKSVQLPLDIPSVISNAKGDFFVSEANRAAWKLIESWPGWRLPVAAVVGPPGSGKSHLARLWRQKSGAALVTSPEQLLPMGALALDFDGPDVELSSGREVELFHAMNRALAGEGDLLLLSQVPPSRWRVKLADLRSRLAAVPVARIEAPDDDLVAAVLLKLFMDRQLRIGPRLVPFLTARLERSLGAARQAVARLDEAALASGAPITPQFASAVLGLRDEDDREEIAS